MQQIYGYQPRSEQDVLVSGWWKFLRDSNELHKLFPASQHSLSSFLASFARPVELVFQLNDGGEVCRAAWFSPSMQVGAEGGVEQNTSPAFPPVPQQPSNGQTGIETLTPADNLTTEGAA